MFNGQVDDSTAGDFFFYPLNVSGGGSHPSLTTRDRELVSVLEVRIEHGDLNPRPLTLQSVTLPTLPWAGWCEFFNCFFFSVTLHIVGLRQYYVYCVRSGITRLTLCGDLPASNEPVHVTRLALEHIDLLMRLLALQDV